ncbi:uncharacterized protein LOC135831701 isoform X2 [Planococcus citri]|uniref:uncharacterized protein LOC135831701 isoform X2 n=1 Tax=Planococcus citri TaxID=170843 RepID=UPI0031F9130A
MKANAKKAYEEGHRKCVGCGRVGYSGLFSIPHEPNLRNLWLKACGIDESTNIAKGTKLCEKHFTEDDFVPCDEGKRKYLKKDAIPSIKVDPEQFNNHRSDYQFHCFVCGTVSGIKHSYHRIPLDPNIREQWLRNVGINIGAFNTTPPSIKLCDSHFSRDDLLVHPQSKIRRLRKGALPFAIKQKEPSKSKIFKVNSSKTSSAKSKAVVAVSNTENISWVPEKSSLRKETVIPIIDLTSFSKKGDVILSIDLTSEDDAHANSESVPEGKQERIRLQKKEKVRPEKELTYSQEPLESKILKATSSTSSQESKTVVASSTKDFSDKKAPDHSTISSKKKSVFHIVDSTLEDVEEPKPPESDLKKKRKRIRQLKEKKVRLDNELTDSQELLESKISKTTSKTLSQTSKTVSVSSTEYVSEDVSLVEESSNLEDVQDPLQSKLDKKKRRIGRLKEKISHFEKEAAECRTLLNDLLTKKLVTKEGRKMIKKYIRNVEAT